MTITVTVTNNGTEAKPEVFVEKQDIVDDYGRDKALFASTELLEPGATREFELWKGRSIRVVQK